MDPTLINWSLANDQSIVVALGDITVYHPTDTLSSDSEANVQPALASPASLSGPNDPPTRAGGQNVTEWKPFQDYWRNWLERGSSILNETILLTPGDVALIARPTPEDEEPYFFEVVYVEPPDLRFDGSPEFGPGFRQPEFEFDLEECLERFKYLTRDQRSKVCTRHRDDGTPYDEWTWVCGFDAHGEHDDPTDFARNNFVWRIGTTVERWEQRSFHKENESEYLLTWTVVPVIESTTEEEAQERFAECVRTLNRLANGWPVSDEDIAKLGTGYEEADES